MSLPPLIVSHANNNCTSGYFSYESIKYNSSKHSQVKMINNRAHARMTANLFTAPNDHTGQAQVILLLTRRQFTNDTISSARSLKRALDSLPGVDALQNGTHHIYSYFSTHHLLHVIHTKKCMRSAQTQFQNLQLKKTQTNI